jgi:hypothetical protein
MCGGGGGGGTNTVQQTITEIPEELAPYYDELLGRGTFQSLQPYTPYPYKRLAEFSPFEQQSMAGIGSLAQTGTPEAMQSAITGSQYVAYQDPYAEAIRKDPITAAVMNTIGAAQPEQVGTLGDISTYDTYMSPYQQKVTDIAKREASRASEIQGADIGQQAALAGGLGGYREAIMQAERQRNLGQQLSDIQVQGDQQAFESAQRAFDTDRAARESASQLALGGYGALQADLGQRLRAAQQASDISSQDQAMELTRLGALGTAGQQQRGLLQQSYDTGYQDFLRQQAFPVEQLSLYSNLVRGMPMQPGTTQVLYGQQPTLSQQLLGSGIAAAGLYGATR